MKTTKNFNLQIPELGDDPDVTQISDAIEALEDSISGNIEVVKGAISGNKLTLTPIVRKTSRRAYYDGLTLHFSATQTIQPNSLTRVELDNLPEQVLSIPFLINSGDMVELKYIGSKFTAVYFSIAKSSSTTSTSEVTIATSRAVKTVNDLANTKEPKFVKNSGFNLSKSDSATSTSTTTLATSRAVKTAYDLANTKEPAISKKSGFNLDKSDSMTSTSTTTLATSKAVKTLNDAKFDKSGGTVSGSLTVTGTVLCNGNITAFSDIRLKENLNIIENPLEKVLKVNGYTYNMIGHKERMTGVIAQELEQVLPEAVNETDKGIKSVAYGNVIGLLIEAIKEQNKEIEKLKALVM